MIPRARIASLAQNSAKLRRNVQPRASLFSIATSRPNPASYRPFVPVSPIFLATRSITIPSIDHSTNSAAKSSITQPASSVAANVDPSAASAVDGASLSAPAIREIPQASSSSVTPEVTTISDPTPLLPQSPATADVPTIESLIAANPDNLADVLASPEAVHAAMRVGDLKLMGLTHGWINPAGWIRDALEYIHVGTGLPWWGTIMLTTACLRLSLFPLVVRMQSHASRMAAISEQQKILMEKIQEAKKKEDKQAGQIYGAQLQKLWSDHDVHPLRSLGLPLVQMPLFIAFFLAVRKMAELPVPQFKEGGLWWFTDLTATDPYYVLPITSVACTLAVLQYGADGIGSKVRSQQHMVNGLRVLSVLFIPFIGKMAAALTFYWTFSNSLTLLQSTILRAKPVKRFFKIREPVTMPLPPGHKPQAPPSMMDSWKEGKEWFKTRARDEAERQAKLRIAARKGNKVAVKKSTLEHTEVIREVNGGQTGGVLDSVDTSVFAEPPAIKAVKPKKGGRVIDHEKEARVAAARARRARQGQ